MSRPGPRITPATVRTAVLLIAAASAGTACATGFFVNQQSVRGLGRVDAGNTAAADELGTIFFNPAGLIAMFDKDESRRASFGLELIVPRSTQRNTGSTGSTAFGSSFTVTGAESHNPTDPTPVPNLYAAQKIADGAGAIGFGINVPFGLATKSGSDWYGRYDAIEASLKTINIGLVGAYRINERWSIGGGVDLQYANTKLVAAIPNPLAPGGPSPATDGRVETYGHAWTPGFNVGLLYAADADTRLGLHYRSGMKHDIEGAATLSGLAAGNGTYRALANVELPAIATAGIWRHVPNTPWTLMAEFEWYQWSHFRDIVTHYDGLPDTVRVTHYRDSFAVAVGADYRIDDAWTLRGGVQYDRTPTVDGFRDTTVPDADRLWLGFGATWRHSNALFVDFAFNHVFFRDTNVDVTRTFFDGAPYATSVRTTGSVESVVNTIAIDFRYRF